MLRMKGSSFLFLDCPLAKFIQKSKKVFFKKSSLKHWYYQHIRYVVMSPIPIQKHSVSFSYHFYVLWWNTIVIKRTTILFREWWSERTSETHSTFACKPILPLSVKKDMASFVFWYFGRCGSAFCENVPKFKIFSIKKALWQMTESYIFLFRKLSFKQISK